MSLDRLVGEGLSEGLNCVAALADESMGLDAGAMSALDGLVRALEAIEGGSVRTSMEVRPGDVEEVRALQAMVGDWMASGQRPEALSGRAKALFERLCEQAVR